MSILRSGNVGIGTTSPSYKLHIVPGDDARGIYIDHNKTTSGSVYGIFIDIDNTYTGSANTYGAYVNARKTGVTNSSVLGTQSLGYDYQTGTGTRSVYGVYGYAYTSSLNGTTSSYGLYGQQSGNADNEYGVYYSGNLGGTGTKSAIVRTPDGPKHVYCQESPGNWFEDFGKGTIQGGQATITLPVDFQETVTISSQHRMKVFVTPNAKFGEWWVEKNGTSFTLFAPNAANGSEFDFRVVAKRQGYEDTRLAPAAGAWTDSFLYPNVEDIPEEYREEWRRLKNGEPDQE